MNSKLQKDKNSIVLISNYKNFLNIIQKILREKCIPSMKASKHAWNCCENTDDVMVVVIMWMQFNFQMVFFEFIRKIKKKKKNNKSSGIREDLSILVCVWFDFALKSPGGFSEVRIHFCFSYDDHIAFQWLFSAIWKIMPWKLEVNSSQCYCYYRKSKADVSDLIN